MYFSDKKFSKYTRGLWLQEKSKIVEHKGIVIQAPGFYDTGEPMQGDILHSFEKQLPYLPKLSFLNFHEVKDLNYKYERREIVV